MFGVERSTQVASSLFHIGGLSGAGTLLAANDPWGAIGISVIACICVVLLTASFVGCEIARVRMARWVRKHQSMPPDPPHDEDREDA